MTSEPEVANIDLGAALRRRRQAQRLTLTLVADLAGMNKNTLSRIERGIRPCRVTELDAIATAMGVNPAELLTVHQPRDSDSSAA